MWTGSFTASIIAAVPTHLLLMQQHKGLYFQTNTLPLLMKINQSIIFIHKYFSYAVQATQSVLQKITHFLSKKRNRKQNYVNEHEKSTQLFSLLREVT